mmetsp:Transcript_48404/g.148916  ORF Transcript_48404/g.148916 Transcript_48404/m.148916 type:complete len:237 (+) Transcript_48404:135-845(+)
MTRSAVCVSRHAARTAAASGTSPGSANLGLGEVHLRVLLHEALEHVLLVLLVGGGQPGRLLPLIVHHLLDGLARLAVEVGELRVLRLHLLRVNLGVAHKEAVPPLHPVHLCQRQGHQPVVLLGVVLDRPRRVLQLDRGVQLPLHERPARCAGHADDQPLLPDLHVELLRLCPLGHRHKHRHVAERLLPPVVAADAAVVDWRLALALLTTLLAVRGRAARRRVARRRVARRAALAAR